MEQQKINYAEIMDLGFTEEFCHDTVYEAVHGYPYSIITKNLTNKIFLEWEKETKLCKMIRIGNPKKCNVIADMPIMNLAYLKKTIQFFKKE